MHQITRAKSIIKIICVTCLLSLPYVRAEAQVAINGTVADENELPVPAATILLLNPSDSSMVKGTITEDSGRFQFQSVKPGLYLLSVSMIGYQTRTTEPFEVGGNPVQMDSVTLLQSVEQLDEISVSARRPLFEQQMDRLVVNVQRSITSSGSSVLEVLEKSPDIQINRQSNSIAMSGKSGVRVMINDKVVRLPTDAVVQMLDGMSAADVEQIELISTPPAKYEAEGDAGIINIKMKELTDMGYTGTVGGNVGYNWAENLGGNMNFSRRGKKLAFFINYSINYDRNEQNWINERYLEQGGFTEEIKSNNRRRPTIGVQNTRVGLEYNIGRKTTAGLLVTGYQRKWETRDLSDNISRLGPDSTLISEMRVQETNLWRNSLLNASLDHSFSENRTLSFDLDYLYYINDNPSVYQNNFVEGNENLMENQGIDVEKETPINIWVGRIDYRHRLSDDLTLETGLKGTLSDFLNDVNVSERIDGSWTVNDRYTNNANLTEKIGAVYLSGNWNPAEDLKINAGLRYEYTDSYLSTPEEHGLIDREYGNLFPSVFINKKLSDDRSIGISYTRRITRPTFTDMAPFVFFLSPNTFLSGTPSLKPAVSDGFKFDFQHDPWLVSLQYSYSRDEIGAFQPEVDPETNEQTYSAQNLEYLRTWALTTSIPLGPAPWWQIQTNLSGRYQIFKTGHLENDVTQKVAGLTANITNTFDLPREFSVEVSGNYQSKSIWGLMQFRPQGSVNAGIQKRISDGRGTLRLSMDDILYTNIWKADTEVLQANLDSFFKYDWHMQVVRFSFTWNFGNNDVGAVNIETGSSEEQGRVNTN